MALLAGEHRVARGLAERPARLSGSRAGAGLHDRRDPDRGGEGSHMNAADDRPLTDPAPYRADLRALYQALDAEVSRLGPVCRLSGRCCRFQEYGHTLFVS